MDDFPSSTPSITLLLSQLDELLADRRQLWGWIRFSVSHDQDQHSPLVQGGTCVLSSAKELLKASQIAPELLEQTIAICCFPPWLVWQGEHWLTLCAITLLLLWHKLHAQWV